MSQNLRVPVIAIDGGAGTGKGTVRKILTKRLGWYGLDSGALYRGLGIVCCLNGAVEKKDWIEIAKGLNFVFDGDRVIVNNKDLTDLVRSNTGSLWASKVSQIHEVREILKSVQFGMRKHPGLVAEGRDMCYLFHTLYRYFLIANPEVRAKRRVIEFQGRGLPADYNSILIGIIERDELDKNRAVQPLKPHPEALIVDTSDLSPEEVVQRILTNFNSYGTM